MVLPMYQDLFKFSGTHYEIGYQHGVQLSNIIKTTIVPFVANDMANRGITNSHSIKIVEKYETLIANHFPEVLQETRGIADGAQIEYQTALLILLFWEVRDTISSTSHDCTSFVAAGDATANGQPIAAQNSDWPMYMKDKNIGQVFQVSSKGNYKFIGRGLAGNLGRPSVIGFNEKGLSFVGSGIHQLHGAEFGFPPLIATRIGLERCSSVREFIELLEKIPHWSHAGENVDVVDFEGNMARISFSSRRLMIVLTRDYFLASTNHYHNNEMRHFGPPNEEAYPSSYTRYDRIIELLTKNYGLINGNRAMQIMSDHKFGNTLPDGDKSICRHGEDRETMTSMISVPKRKEFWIASGSPCVKKYNLFKL
jgi:isopenicillin-N N-acyltransferase-like protein